MSEHDTYFYNIFYFQIQNKKKKKLFTPWLFDSPKDQLFEKLTLVLINVYTVFYVQKRG